MMFRLGMDIGYNLDVIASEDAIRIDGRSIPSTDVRGNHLFRITALDTYEINGDTECEIEVYIEGMLLDEYQTEMLIEPSPEFLRKCPVVVARSLVDMRNHVTGRVRVMNPFRDITVIRQGTIVGFTEPLKNEIGIISIVIPQNDVAGHPDKSGGGSGALQSLSEHGGSIMASGDVNATEGVAEVSDPGPLRVENKDRVVDSLPVFGERSMMNLVDDQSDELQEVSAKANMAHGNKGLTLASDDYHVNKIPPYLRELYDKSICGKLDEKIVIESLLVHYQDIFSKDETDLGRTHLIEHEIDIGNVKTH